MSAAASVANKDIQPASIRLGRRAGGACNRLLEVGKLLAAAGTQLLEQRDVLACLIHLPGLDVELAQIFERAFVLGVEVERFAIERVGLLVVSGFAQAEPHQI